MTCTGAFAGVAEGCSQQHLVGASLFADCRWLPAFNCCHFPRVGPDAAEIMQGLAIALKCGATKAQFDATVGIHPSAAEVGVTDRDNEAGHAAGRDGSVKPAPSCWGENAAVRNDVTQLVARSLQHSCHMLHEFNRPVVTCEHICQPMHDCFRKFATPLQLQSQLLMQLVVLVPVALPLVVVLIAHAVSRMQEFVTMRTRTRQVQGTGTAKL